MKSVFTLLLLLFAQYVFSQITFPVNGVVNSYESTHAFINATLVVSPQQRIQNGTLIIKGDEILRADADTTIPEGAIIHDMKGKYIYPSFIDLNANYGIKESKKVKWKPSPQYKSNTKSGAGWNEAIHPEFNANSLFAYDEDCLLYTSPSPRDGLLSRMPSSA